jgi:predicted amidohydrolase YtcJ
MTLSVFLILKRKKRKFEVGKWADFCNVNRDLMKVEENKIVK